MIQPSRRVAQRLVSAPLALVPALLISTCILATAQTTVDVVAVVSRTVDREAKLPGEFRPWMEVPIHAKVTGFVEKFAVDRGSAVHKGQLLVTLSAPELTAQIAEAESKVQAAVLQKAEAVAKLESAESTFERLKAAAQTPGVVAGNDLVSAQKSVEAARAVVDAQEGLVKAAQAAVQSIRDLRSYLTITAPFDGMITERNVHPGALVGPNAAGSPPLLVLQQLARLRLVAAVPEALVGGLIPNARVSFTVPAYPGEKFQGTVARISHSLDERTRTMPVELDVANPSLRLAPGMYPEVAWPVRKPRPSLLAPPSAIVTTTVRMFVIRASSGVAEWVNVSRGAPAGDLVEVYGPLTPGDLIVKRATDELREGTRLSIRRAAR